MCVGRYVGRPTTTGPSPRWRSVTEAIMPLSTPEAVVP